MKSTSTGRLLGRYFFRGLLVLVPITLVIVTIYQVFMFLDRLIPFEIPGLGLLTLLVVITTAGYLASTILFQPFADLGNELLGRIPILNTLYTAVKDIMEAFVGNKRKFDRPVMVKMIAGSTLEKPGFITNDDLSHLGVEGAMVAVYLPHSFAWSGNTFIVPADQVTPINAKAADVMKFILSGGVAGIEAERSPQ